MERTLNSGIWVCQVKKSWENEANNKPMPKLWLKYSKYIQRYKDFMEKPINVSFPIPNQMIIILTNDVYTTYRTITMLPH